MVAWLAMIFIVIGSLIGILGFACIYYNIFKYAIIFFSWLILFIIGVCCLNRIIEKDIIRIGQEIDDKKVIGYEDRIVLIEEEGGIEIPWYIQVNEFEFSDSYWVAVTGGSSISVYLPEKEKKYSSLVY